MNQQLGEPVGQIAPNGALLNVLSIPIAMLTCGGTVWFAQLMPHATPLNSLSESPEHALGWFLGLTAGLVVLHELLHGVGAWWFGRLSWRAIGFGIMWRYLMPYCHYDGPIRVCGYRRLTLIPLLVLGPISLIGVCAFPSLSMAMAAGVHLAACIGDVWVWFGLRRFRADYWVVDFPDRVGGAVYAPAIADARSA